MIRQSKARETCPILSVRNVVKIFFIIYSCFETDICASFGTVIGLLPPKSVVCLMTAFGCVQLTFSRIVGYPISNFWRKLLKLGLMALLHSKRKALCTVEVVRSLTLFE